MAVKIRRSGDHWQHEKWVFARQTPRALVKAVNRVANRFHGQKGGSFYINEYHQVLKPIYDGDDVTLYYVGEFPDLSLAFPLDDVLWTVGPGSTAPPADLEPGDEWVGPRCGIPYWITRRSGRIYRPVIQWFENDYVRREDRDYLDDYSSDYSPLSTSVKARKMGSGGKFYVNGAGHIFTPYQRGSRDWGYAYAGRLWELVDRDSWYPKTTMQ